MSISRSISTILLAALSLVSSTSFAVGVHECGGHVQSVALFGKADGCVMEMDMNCPSCNDQLIVHESDDSQKSSVGVDLQAASVGSVAIVAPIIGLVHPVASQPSISRIFYDPPLPTSDVTVRLQVFLI